MPRGALPLVGIEAFPSKETLRGVSIRDTPTMEAELAAQERWPGASSLCLVHIAMASWRGQQPREVERDANNITTVSNPAAVPCQIARYPKV